MKSLIKANINFKDYFADILYDLVNIKENQNISKDVLINQILFTGYEAFSIIAMISLLLGAVIIHQGYSVLESFGQTELIYDILVSAVVRDFAPIIISFIILARSGTAISTELGNMVLNKEIDALKAFGISPISYIVTPRILGMILSMVILTLYFSIFGIFGGYIVSSLFNPLPFGEFFDNFIKSLSFLDIQVTFFKIIFSAFAISVISSFHGLSVKSATTEVPQRNIAAVKGSVFSIFIINIAGILIHIFFKG